MTNKPAKRPSGLDVHYDSILGDISNVIEAARKSAARSANRLMTAVYWLIGRRIVEFEQKGERRAEYGEELIGHLAADLSGRYGKGFSIRNVWQMKAFYLTWPIPQAPSAESKEGSILQTLSAELALSDIAPCFPLPWSAYVRLLAVKNDNARRFYETEALRGGWSVRQLDRQINSQFYERTALSRDKAAMLRKGGKSLPRDRISPEEEIKDPYVLDLLFFHRRLRCLVVIDLKIGKFSHADAGQMHLYLNYAREHWVREGENPPVGLILCAQRGDALARYALENLPNKVLAAEYRTVLPDEKTLAREVERTQAMLGQRGQRFLPPAGERELKKRSGRDME